MCVCVCLCDGRQVCRLVELEAASAEVEVVVKVVMRCGGVSCRVCRLLRIELNVCECVVCVCEVC